MKGKSSGPRIEDIEDKSSTPGAVTIKKPNFKVAIAAAASSVVVTHALATTKTICEVQLVTADGTLKSVVAVCTAGTITITGNAAAAGACSIYGELIQPG